MPFIGTTAPLGWLLCNGDAIPTAPHTVALRSLLRGSNTPDLQGMFLRGTGTSPLSTATVVKEGPELMSTQQDSNKEHSHNEGSLDTAADGDHNHHTVDANGTMYNKMTRASGDRPNQWYPFGSEGNTSYASSTYVAKRLDLQNNVIQKDSEKHKHTISGAVEATGGIESRPVNYGVNYIIKL